MLLHDLFFNSNNFRLVKQLRTVFEQLIPAYVIDFFLLIGRKKPLFVRLQQKIKKAVVVLEYFTTKQWEFTNDNYLMIMNELNETDNKVSWSQKYKFLSQTNRHFYWYLIWNLRFLILIWLISTGNVTLRTIALAQKCI